VTLDETIPARANTTRRLNNQLSIEKSPQPTLLGVVGAANAPSAESAISARTRSNPSPTRSIHGRAQVDGDDCS